jgi:flagellar assembly factor FliW
MTFNFLGPGLTVNVEAKVKEQIILDSSDFSYVVGQKSGKTSECAYCS